MRLRGSIRVVAALAGALIGLTCSSAPAGPTVPPFIGDGRRVLFIGNSLTYWNDLPLIAQSLADSAGGASLAVMVVAFPDFSLDDHRAEGTAQRAIDQTNRCRECRGRLAVRRSRSSRGRLR